MLLGEAGCYRLSTQSGFSDSWWRAGLWVPPPAISIDICGVARAPLLASEYTVPLPVKRIPICLYFPTVQVVYCLTWVPEPSCLYWWAAVQPVWKADKNIYQELYWFPFLFLKHSVCSVPGETMKHTHLPLLLIIFLMTVWMASCSAMWETAALQYTDQERNFYLSEALGRQSLNEPAVSFELFHFWTFF